MGILRPAPETEGLYRRSFMKAAAVSGLTLPLISRESRAQQTTTDNWPMFQYDTANTGSNPATGGVETNIEVKWTAAAEDRVYSSPAIVDGVLYIGSTDGNVYALDAESGATEWVFETGGGIYSSPAVVDGTLFIGSSDSALYALDAEDGSEQWMFETGGSVSSSPTVRNGIVYFGGLDSSVYAVDAERGSLEWTFQTEGMVSGVPAVDGGTVYIGSFDETLYALDAVTGTPEWKYHAKGEIREGPSVADGTVFVGTKNIDTSSETAENVYAVDAADGSEVWTVETVGRVDGSPAVADGVLYIPSSKVLYALDAADGTQHWSYHADNQIHSPPTVVKNTVYVGKNGNEFLALDAADGSERWKVGLDSGVGVAAGAAVLNNVVYFGANSASAPHVYAIAGEEVATEVSIDIKPSNDRNRVNPNSRGYVNVAIHHTEAFNPVDRVDVSTLRFGAPDEVEAGGGATPAHEGGHEADVDGDRDDDLLLHFPMEDTGFDEDDEQGKLVGKTDDGTPLYGSDSVKTT